jgi:hypothetical protein
MNKNLALGVVAVVVAAIAILYFTVFKPPEPRLLSRCGGNPHCREVSVKMVGGVATIESIQDATFTAPGIMQWEIVTEGYSFPGDGINFYPTPPKPSPNQAPAGEFHNCKAMPPTRPNPTSYQCNVKHDAIGKWAYLVTLQKAGSPDVVLDPFVVNR